MHSPECRAALMRHAAAAAEWQQAFPHHCRSCFGWGGSLTTQSHPFGSTVAHEDLFEPCPSCLSVGLCPRCGSDVADDVIDGDVPCPSCGWRVDAPDAGCPDDADYCDGSCTDAPCPVCGLMLSAGNSCPCILDEVNA